MSILPNGPKIPMISRDVPDAADPYPWEMSEPPVPQPSVPGAKTRLGSGEMRRGPAGDPRRPTRICWIPQAGRNSRTRILGGSCASRVNSWRASAPWPILARRSVSSAPPAPSPARHYAIAEEIGRLLVRQNFAVITGGGPGSDGGGQQGGREAGGSRWDWALSCPLSKG